MSKIDDAEATYQLQRKQSMEKTKKIYRAKKVKVVDKVLRNDKFWEDIKPFMLNAISTAVFTLTYLSARANHHTLTQKITGLAAIIGAITLTISANKIRKMIRDAWSSVAGIETQESNLIGIEQKDQKLIEESSTARITDQKLNEGKTR